MADIDLCSGYIAIGIDADLFWEVRHTEQEMIDFIRNNNF